MPSNLRAFPIQGYVSDAAGNILRNAAITVKESTPAGSSSIDSVVSDDGGYFITKPVKNGVYDIYESGIRVSRSIHNTGPSNIQPYLASSENIPNGLPQYDQLGLGNTDDTDINNFRYYLQLENNDMDIKNYGHLFPIDEPNLTVGDDFTTFHGMDENNSRATTTRFDVEFFTQSPYKRIRWVGVPAIYFTSGSRLLLPLDFYSIRINRPNRTSSGFSVECLLDTGDDTIELNRDDNNADLALIADTATKGDIFKIGSGVYFCYGIYVDTVSGVMRLKRWRSSNYISDGYFDDVTRMADAVTQYDGFFSSINNITSSISEKFTVFENIEAQNSDVEMYNYSDAS